MKIALVIPSRESEKAISSYAMEITKNVKKQNINIENVFYEAGSFKSFFKIIPKLNHDIIHLFHEYNILGNFGFPFFLIFPLLALKKSKLVTMMSTVLSQKEVFKGSFLKNFLRKYLYFFQNRLINWTSDSVIVTMKSHKDILVKEYGFNPDKIEIFTSGGPTNFKITPKQKAKEELKLKGNVYLIIGNLVPDHGAQTILEQAKKIKGTILIVGNPNPINDRNKERIQNYLKSLKDYVKENNIKNVRFDIFDITDENPLWYKYFSASDIVLQAYRQGIGSGIFLHSIATKTPVVSSDTEFFREIKEKFDCLELVKEEKDYPKIIENVMKPENYNKKVEGCKKYLKENSWDKISKKYKELYEDLLMGDFYIPEYYKY